MIRRIECAPRELEEIGYRLELLADSGIVKAGMLADLMKETDELTPILVTGVKTVKSRGTT